MSQPYEKRERRSIRVAIADACKPRIAALRTALAGDPRVEVCAAVTTASEAIRCGEKERPDVWIVDAALAQWGAPALLKALQTLQPSAPIVLVCMVDRAGAAAALAGIAAGATDYLVLGSDPGPELGAALAGELASRICVLAGSSAREAVGPVRTTGAKGSPTKPRERRESATPVEVIVIASSTGGPKALLEVVRPLPASLPVPILIAQHMPADFTGRFAQSLAQGSALGASEARDGEIARRGCIYIAPGDRHILIERHGTDARIRLDDGPLENFCRPSADPLFRSAARHFGPGVLAIVMTGMGQDGMLGAQTVSEAGGQVVVQDSESSAVWGMAGSVVSAGFADAVFPLADLGLEIAYRTGASSRPID